MGYLQDQIVIIDLGTLDYSNLHSSVNAFTCPSSIEQLIKNGMDLFYIYKVISNGRYSGAIYKVDGEDSETNLCRYTFDIDDSNIVRVAPDGEYECLYEYGRDRTLVRRRCLLDNGFLVSIYKEGEGWIDPDFNIEYDLINVFSINRRIVPTKSNKIDMKSGSFELEESLFY